MKLVECPICDSKFDIERVPEGTKLKCGKCQKIFGVVRSGDMVPIAVTQIAQPATPRPAPKPAVVKKEDFEEERRPVPAFRKPIRREPPKPKRKPEPLLYVSSLIALVAIGALIYLLKEIEPNTTVNNNVQQIKNTDTKSSPKTPDKSSPDTTDKKGDTTK